MGIVYSSGKGKLMWQFDLRTLFSFFFQTFEQRRRRRRKEKRNNQHVNMRERELGQVFFGSRTYEAAGAIRTPWMVVLVLRGYKLFGGLGKKSLTHSNFQGPKREEDGEKEVKMTTKRRGHGFLFFFSFLLFYFSYSIEMKKNICHQPAPLSDGLALEIENFSFSPTPSRHHHHHRGICEQYINISSFARPPPTWRAEPK